MRKRKHLGTVATGALWLAVSGCWPYGGYGPTTQTVVTPLIDGLNNPTSLLLTTDGRLIVAESGAGRIITRDAEGNVSTLVDGFTVGTYAPFHIGPLSLATSADGGLIVGEGGNRAGRERVSFCSSDGSPTADALVPAGGSDFFDVLVEPATGNLYIASTGSDRIHVATPTESGGFSVPTDFVADTTADPIGAAAPAALLFDSQGRLLVAFADNRGGKIVALNTSPDAQSVFVEELVADAAPIPSMAIRPSDGALAYVAMESTRSGSIRILDAQGTLSTWASGLTGPTDIVFDAQDVLYVTLLGDTPNAAAGSIATVEIVEITTNGANTNGNGNTP